MRHPHCHGVIPCYMSQSSHIFNCRDALTVSLFSRCKDTTVCAHKQENKWFCGISHLFIDLCQRCCVRTQGRLKALAHEKMRCAEGRPPLCRAWCAPPLLPAHAKGGASPDCGEKHRLLLMCVCVIHISIHRASACLRACRRGLRRCLARSQSGSRPEAPRHR